MKKPKARPAWVVLYRGRLGTCVCTDKQEAVGLLGKGEKVQMVMMVPVGKPFDGNGSKGE